MSAATAIASGTTNSSAATSQRVIDPGPACAAAGIQRVPTMHAIANSVVSRSPISRFNAGCGLVPVLKRRLSIHFAAQFFSDSSQPLAQKLGLAADPDAQEPLDS